MSTQPKLSGKVAVITGGGQGIGQAITIRLAEEGADVAISGRHDSDSVAETVAAVEKLGRKIIFVQNDVSKREDNKKLIEAAVTQLGKVDVLVNNAGVERSADFWNVTEADYDMVLDTNLRGTFFLTQDFVNHLRATKRTGTIINISSVHEELPFPHFAAYCASKGALRMLCRNLAVELGPLGITINNIAPGAIATPINEKLLNSPDLLKSLLSQIPLGRLGKPNDVASLAAFLASDEASYVTGSTFVVDGGLLWNYQEQ